MLHLRLWLQGLSATSVEDFVAYIVSQDNVGVASVPGFTDKIIAAGTEAVLATYAQAFRYVWQSAIPFLAIAAIAAMFLIDPSKECNSLIDAPLEESETEGEYWS